MCPRRHDPVVETIDALSAKAAIVDDSKFLAIVVRRGMATEVNYFRSYDDAWRYLLEAATHFGGTKCNNLRAANEGENHYSVWERDGERAHRYIEVT